MHRNRKTSLLTATALSLALLCAVAGCGPDVAKQQRAQVEELERAERARVQAKAELDADQERFKKISTSLADPRNPGAAESQSPRAAGTAPAESPPPVPIAVVATPGEQALLPAAAFKQLQRTVGVLERIEAEGVDCATTLRTYTQPDKAQQNGCLKFLNRNTEYLAAIQAVDSLAGNEQFLRENQINFAKAKWLIESVESFRDFASTRMRTLTGRTSP